MAWVLLATTILLEVAGTILMKLSNGFENAAPSVGAFVCYGLALAGLTYALKSIELSTAYAIWAGGGTALTALIGILWFRESAPMIKLVCLALVFVGVVGLQLASAPKS
jgi:small multidrug resistance pump